MHGSMDQEGVDSGDAVQYISKYSGGGLITSREKLDVAHPRRLRIKTFEPSQSSFEALDQRSGIARALQYFM